MLFGKRSERRHRTSCDAASSSPSTQDSEGYGGKNKGNKGRQLPNDRYPNAEIQERHIFPDVAPSCNACGCEMKDSGLSEV